MSIDTLTTLTWLVPAGPLLAFFLIALFFNKNKTLSWVTAWAGVLTSVVLGWIIAFNLFFMDLVELEHHPVVVHSAVDWLPFFRPASGWLQMGVSVDPLTAMMLFMVPFAVFMIFMYSVGYHNYGMKNGTVRGIPNHGMQEPLFSRFFAFMSLFAGAMRPEVVEEPADTLGGKQRDGDKAEAQKDRPPIHPLDGVEAEVDVGSLPACEPR